MYAEGATFPCERIVSLGRGIAEAARHLHDRGILHGDLYAHNTLVSHNHALVSDFGAACVYRANTSLNHKLIEKIEVRAFGILLGELVARASAEVDRDTLRSLKALVHSCTAADVAARPRFEEICQRLKAIDVG